MSTTVPHADSPATGGCPPAERERCLGPERLSAIVAERERIARELHDSPAQALATLHLRLRALDAHPGLADLDAVRAELTDLAAVCALALAEVRAEIRALRDCCGESRPLPDLLETLVGRFRRTTGLQTSLCLATDRGAHLPPDAVAHVARIVSEALTNVHKHADARTVGVRVEEDAAHVVVTVDDDGRGLAAPRSGDGYGLQVMRERATLAGGVLELGAGPEGGTRVRVRLPAGRAAS